MRDEAAVARSLGDMGVVVSGEGVRGSTRGEEGRRRRVRREWRGGRRSKSWGGGRGVVVAVGMVCGGFVFEIVGRQRKMLRSKWEDDCLIFGQI